MHALSPVPEPHAHDGSQSLTEHPPHPAVREGHDEAGMAVLRGTGSPNIWAEPWPFSDSERLAFAAGRRVGSQVRQQRPMPQHLVDDVAMVLATTEAPRRAARAAADVPWTP